MFLITRKYKYAGFATFLDYVFAFAGAGAVAGIYYGNRDNDSVCLFLGVITLIVAVIMKLLIIPKIAEKIVDKKYAESMKAREQLAIKKIEPISFENKVLMIKCPNCTEPVKERSRCKCGCNIWRTDEFFIEEVDAIYRSYGVENKYNMT